MNSEERARPGFWQLLGNCYGTATDQANGRRLNLWSVAWGLSIVAASWLLTSFELPMVLTVIIVAAPNVVMAMTLRIYMQYLEMADELLQRIQIEGLAIGFGISWLGALAYLVANVAGAPELSMTLVVLLLTAAWMAGNIIAIRRYL